MNQELYQTTKICKCGQRMTVEYDLKPPDEQGIEAIEGCSLRSRRGQAWPNSVFCKGTGCIRTHRLESFKRSA